MISDNVDVSKPTLALRSP